MFNNLIPAWLRRPSAAKRPLRKKINLSDFRPTVETLEDRLAPASIVFGGLELMTTGAFTTQGNQVTTTSPVQVGVNPANGAAFVPLLSLAGGVQFMNNDASGTITSTGPTQLNEGGLNITAQNIQLHYSAANNEFDISGQASVTIAGNTVGLTLGSDATPGLVLVNGNLQSLQATLTLPAGKTTIAFTVQGLSFQLSSASLTYDSATTSFGIGGSATLSTLGQTLTVNLGTADMPGVMIQNGVLTTLDASISTDVKIAGLDFKAEDLAVHYAVADPDVTIMGKASIEVKDQSVEVALGTTDNGVTHPGIEIDKSSGQLIELDAAITTDLSIGGATIKADDLAVHYSKGDSIVTITGAASFELDDQSVAVMLGTADHPGIAIDATTGQFISLDASVTSDITVAGLDIKTDGLGVDYQANELDIYGAASFELKGQSVGIALGDAATPGIQITNGQLTSLTASVTTDLDLLGIQLTTNELTVAYMPNQQLIEIYGDVSVTTKFVSFDSTLGTADDPGIEISNGALTQLNITVSGGFSLFGFNVAANGLMISYSGSQLELSGGVMVQLTSSFQIAASINQGGLVIDTNTGALSLDTSKGLDISGSIKFGNYGISLDVGFSNGPSGINFHASGEVDLPDNIKVQLNELDIVNGQLADIGLTLAAPVPIGDTGFFLDSISGNLENLNDPSHLIVSASVEVSFGMKINIPAVPGIFGGADAAIVDATGSITVSATELDLSGQVTLLGGLLGQGNATLDLNFATGVYSVSGGFSMYDGIIGFNGSLTITNQGDISLLATASVNVPGVIPFIGGDNLGNINFYLQYRPEDDATQSYVSAWTTVNLFITSFTFGFKCDFAGDFSLLDGNDVNAIAAAAAMSEIPANSTTQKAVQYVYSMDYDVTDPGAASAQVTLSSLDFFDALYAYGDTTETVQSDFAGGAGGYSLTGFQLSHANVILPSFSFEVDSDFGYGLVDVGRVYFDAIGSFHFATTGKTMIVPTGANVSAAGQVTLIWNGTPGTTQIQATYNSSDAEIQVLQNTGTGPVDVGDFTVDPTSTAGQGGLPAASAGSAIYNDNLLGTTPIFAHNGYSTTYTLSNGDPNLQSLSFKVSVANKVIGNYAADQNGDFQFTPVGTPAIAPTGVLIKDNTVSLTWSTNPITTSIKATYNSMTDRVININFPNGNPADYTVQLVTSTPLLLPPMFTETTLYKAPSVQFGFDSPTLQANGSITGNFSALSYVPGAGQGGVQGSPKDTKISLYCTPNDSTTGGTLIETVDYGSLEDNGTNVSRNGAFNWEGFQSLHAGEYFVYAVINDGQNIQQESALAGPFTTTGPTPILSAPSFLALTPTATASEQATFSAADSTPLVVSMSYATPVTIDLTVNKGGEILVPGSTTPVAEFTNTYASTAAATTALDGLQFIADDTFVNSTTLTLTATTGLLDIQGNPFMATETIPLLTPNTHLVVTEQTSSTVNAVNVTYGGSFYASTPSVVFTSSDGLGAGATGTAIVQGKRIVGVTITNPGIGYDAPPLVSFVGGNPLVPATATATINAPPADPNTAIVTITVSNPGGPDGEDGTNVHIQDYPSAGLTVLSSSVSQGTFDPATNLWTIGNLPISATNAVTLTLTLAANPGTNDMPLTNLADGSSVPFAYPDADAANVVTVAPLSHGVVFNPGTLPAAALGAPYQFTLTADGGGGGPYTYAVTGSNLPAGLTLSPNGTLSGIPSGQAGENDFTVAATGKSGLSTSAAVDLPIANLPVGVVGTAYSASAGAAAFGSAYQFESGNLPPGVTVDLSSGAPVLTGTPTAAGVYDFVIRDNIIFVAGVYSDTSYTLAVDQPLAVTTTTLATATQNTPFSQMLTATGGTGTLTFAVTSGSLPAGLTLAANGMLSGTPTVQTTALGSGANTNFAVTVSDGLGLAATVSYSVPVNAAIVAGPSASMNLVVGSPFSEQLTATGGSGSGYTFAVSPGSSLLAGLTLSADGILSGTLPANTVADNSLVSIRITDASGGYADAVYQLVVFPAITTTPPTLPLVVDGTPYSQVLSATGGSSTSYTFAVTAGSLPTGLALSFGGTLSGTVAAMTPAGTFDFTVTVTDGFGATGVQTYSLTVDPALSVSTMNLSNALQNMPYSEAVTFAGGNGGPVSFAATAGTLPPGLTLFANGALTGSIPMSTPPGVYDFTVTATDALGNSDDQFFALNVEPGIELTPTSFPLGFVNTAYAQTLSASGGAAPYTFAVSAGSLPAGLTLTAAGKLSGTIATTAAVGTFNFDLTATDAHGSAGAQAYSIAVDRPVALSTATVSAATVNSLYTQKLAATGGTGSGYAFTLSAGSLPAGLTLATNGTISGTVPVGTVAGNVAFTVKVTDSLGVAANHAYTLHIDPAVNVSTSSLPAITLNSTYSAKLSATGGSGKGYVFAVTAGQLPAGLTLAKNGTLSGIVRSTTIAGPYNFTVAATDSLGGIGSKNYTLTVPLAATLSGPIDGFKGVEGEQRTFRVGVLNGSAQAAFTYSINWGDGTPTAPDVQVISATAGNGAGILVSHTYALRGNYAVHLTAIASTGQVSSTVALTVPIVVAEQQGSAFTVGGTAGNDNIVFTHGAAASFQISLNGVSAGTFTPRGSIQIHGDAGNDNVTINGTAGNDLFALNNLTVTLNNTVFQADGIESWTFNGLAGNDTLMDMSTLPSVPVTFDGGTGINSLIGPDDPSTWNINAANAGNVGNVTFRNGQNLQGGAGDDTFLFANAGSVRSLDGGTGNDTLVGPNKSNLWSINGVNKGALNGMLFNHIENLIGGSASDLFSFTETGSVLSIDGGSLNGVGDGLDYSAFNTPVAVNLTTGSATDVDDGAAGAVKNIQNVTGGSGNDTLIGNGNNNLLNGGKGQNTIVPGPQN